MKKLLLIFSLMAGWIAASAQTYCTTGLYGTGCAAGDDLDGITFSGFTHSATGCSTNGYGDYTSTIITVVQSQTPYPFQGTTTYAFGNEYFGVWIDWNDDGDFTDAGEFVLYSPTSHGAGTPFNGTILIDNTKPVGQHRMRVRVIYGSLVTAANSCSNHTWGECHDYTLDVLPDVVGGCTNLFSNFGVDSVLAVSAKVNWTPGTGNTSWYLEYGISGFTPGTAAGTKITGTYPSATQPPVYLSGLIANTQYDVYFGEICNTGLDTAYLGSPMTFTTTVSCPDPTGLVASALSATSGTASWTSLLSTSYEVILGAAGFDPAISGTSTITTNTTTNFASLTANTPYDVYLIGDCGAGGLSDTVGPVSFRTPCVVATAPFSENFDSTSSWFASGSNTGNTIDPCWTSSPDVSQGSVPFKWIPRGTGPTSGNGPLQDATGGNFMYVEASGSSSGDIAFLTTPPIDVSGLTTPGLYFHQHRYSGATIADMDVEVSNDFGNSWNSEYSISGDKQTSSSDPWSLEFVNLAAYTGDTVMIRFRQDGNGCCGDAAIDSVVVDEAPTCPWPTGFAMTNRTDSSVTVTWNDPTGSNWELKWGPPGFTQASPGAGTKTTAYNPDTIQGLQSNTEYEVYVRTDCGPNGTSIWIGPITVRTSCSPFAAPYSDNFDNSPNNAVPYCWANYITGGRTTNGVAQTYQFGTPFSSPNHIRFYDGNPAGPTDTTLLISPKFSDLTVGDKRIQFMANGATTGSNNLIVGTMGDPLDVLSFNALDTIPLSNGYQLYVQDLTTAAGYNGTDEYVAFRHGNSSTFLTIYIDDFVYEAIPPCNPPLINTLGLAGASTTTANIYWGAGSDGNETHWEVGPVGFTPGTGTYIAADSVAGNIDTTVVTGLSAQTCYQFYIRDSCASNGFSPWIGPYKFCTPCVAQSMPYYESFDMVTPTCWDSVGGAWFWTQFNTGTPDNYAEADFWGHSSGQAVLTSPPIAITVDAQVRFDWSHLYNTFYPDDELMVRASVVGTGVWDTILSLKGATNFNDPTAGNSNSPGSFITEDVLLNPLVYTGNDVIIEMRAITDFGPDLFINDFYVEAAPTCPKLIGQTVTNVSDTSATLDWIMAPSAASYQVWFGPQGFFQGTATVGGVQSFTTGDSLIVDTLSGNTCYEFLVRSVCSPGDTSKWVGPYAFCTPCSPLTAPYYETFDLLSTNMAGDLGNCWVGSGTTSTYSWRTNSGATGSGATGPNGDATTGSGVYIYTEASSGSSGDIATMTSPLVDISALSSPEMRFSYHMYGANIDTLYVDIFDGNTWNMGVMHLDEQQQTSSADPWKDTVISLAPYASNNLVQARFRLKSRGCCPGDAAIDDVEFDQPITCAQPTALAVSNIGTTTADAAWTSNGTSGMNFEISYGPSIASPTAGTKVLVSTGASYNFTGLTAATGYCMYVREICGAADTSFWTGPVCFTTNCVPYNTPYYESYNTWPLICWDHTGGSNQWAQNATYAYANFWGWISDSAVMTSPIINISGDSRIRYKWSHLYNSSYPNDRLDVRVSIVGQPGYVTLDSKIGPTFNDPTAFSTSPGSFIEDTLVLDPTIYNGQSIQVHLVAKSGFGPNLYVDDFYVEEITVGCVAPTNVVANVIACDSIEVTWNGSNDSTVIAYGPTGATPNMAALVLNDSTYYITGTTANTGYDVYVANICDGDTSILTGPVTFNTGTTGAPVAAFTGVPAGAGSLTYNFDASGSTGNGNSYTWDYGDGNTGSGVTSSNTYAAGGSYTVKLVVTNACGSDSITVTFADVSLDESELAKHLKLYPNPASEVLNVELSLEGASEVSVRILDMSGKQVIAVSKDKKDKLMTESINISDLAKGVYMIEVSAGQEKTVRRLVKE